MLSTRLFWLMEKYDVDLVLGLLAITRANDISIDVADKSGLFLSILEESTLYHLTVLEDPRRSASTHPAFPVHY